MLEPVKITFYKVSQCGFYPYRKGAKPLFGDLDSLLVQLNAWGSDKLLAHSKTYNVRDGSSLVPTYLVDVRKSDDEWLLTLWNEAPSTDGKVASINGNANVGRASVAETEIKDGHIPGIATYFWLLPKQGLVASVRFQHPSNGMRQMNRYMHGFVSTFSEHVVQGTPDDAGQIKIVGYRENENAETRTLRPKFRTDVFLKPGPIDYLLKNSSLVRKVRKKAELNLALKTDKKFWQTLLVQTHLVKHKTAVQEIGISYEMDVDGLDESEVKAIVGQWETEEFDEQETDYGFDLRGDSKTYWLKRDFARDTLEFEVDRENAELVKPDSLLKELARHRAHLLSLLRAKGG